MKCSHNHTDLILYRYGELDPAAEQAVEARLSVCPACRTELAALVQLESAIPRNPTVVLDDDSMSAIRSATRHRLEDAAAYRPSVIGSWLSRPTIRWALVPAMLVLIFLSGRWSASDGSGAEAMETPQLAENTSLPQVSRVSDLSFDAETGLVQISYEAVGESMLTGDLSDARVRALLGQVLLDSDNPNGRLRAAKLLAQPSTLDVHPDADLVLALEEVIRNESNEGIRLQSLKALHRLMKGETISDSLKEMLIGILADEENSALRIEALGLLTESELASMERQRILGYTESDNNPLIRMQARNAFGEEPTKRLESLN